MPGTVVARLLSRTEIADRTMAYRFDKPSGWMFRPGQWVDMTLIEPAETDGKRNMRSFSIASAPHEDFLMFATRMRDTAFKRVLAGMKLGTEVKIDGPFGEMTIDENSARPAVLLAGGIGITPFRSMVVDAAKQNRSTAIYLFFSNRRPEDTAFLDELLVCERENANFKLTCTMTKMTDSAHSWQGESRKIGQEMISMNLSGARDPVFFLAGPPGMVGGLREMLSAGGVLQEDIRAEEFSGY